MEGRAVVGSFEGEDVGRMWGGWRWLRKEGLWL
jgi:hypothetical protein